MRSWLGFCLAAAASLASATADADPEFDAQWGLAIINANRAYEMGFTGSGVHVGVLDSGLDITHPEFIGRLSGISLDTTTSGPVLGDPVGHGTHVTGILGANRDGIGMMGVAHGALISPFTIALTTPALEVAVPDILSLGLSNGIQIYNNSWGLDMPVTDFTATTAEAFIPNMLAAFRDAVSQDALIAFAAGNQANSEVQLMAGLPFLFPELQSNWLAVTAVTRNLVPASDANACGVAADWCLAAPGGEIPIDGGIFSTVPGAVPGDRSYDVKDGTSMATAHVTGALAIGREMLPGASGSELAQFVLQTSTDLGAVGIDPIFGWGLLNIGAMADAVTPGNHALFANTVAARTSTLSQLSSTVLDRLEAWHDGGQDDTPAPGALAFWEPNEPLASYGQTGARWEALWAQAFLARGEIDGQSGGPGVDADVEGGVLGVDFGDDGDSLHFGLAAALTRTHASEDSTSNTSTAIGYHGLGYLGWVERPWFVDAAAGAGYFDQEFRRSAIPGTGQSAMSGLAGSADTDDFGYFATARTGYTAVYDATVLEPFVEASLVGQHLGGDEETGAGIFSLTIPSESFLVGEVGGGARLAARFDMNGLRLSPEVEVSYAHLFGDVDAAVAVELLGTPLGTSSGADGRDVLRVEPGLRVESPDRPLSAYVGYVGEFRDGLALHSAEAGITLRF